MKLRFWPFNRKKKTVVTKSLVTIPERRSYASGLYTPHHDVTVIHRPSTTMIVDDPVEDVMEAVLINNLIQAEVAAEAAVAASAPVFYSDPAPSYDYSSPSSDYTPCDSPSYDSSYDSSCSYDSSNY